MEVVKPVAVCYGNISWSFIQRNISAIRKTLAGNDIMDCNFTSYYCRIIDYLGALTLTRPMQELRNLLDIVSSQEGGNKKANSDKIFKRVSV